MKQLVLDLKSGATTLAEVPAPMVADGQVLIQTSCSLVSLGTERMLVQFGQAGWLGKMRRQPERVKQVIQKIRTDGLRPTLNAVFNKLGQPLPLGYSQSGRVLGVGRGVPGLKAGDRVVSNGPHAEVVSVPHRLVAKVPDGVSDEAAAFTVVGAIALQSIRLLQPTFGETIAVIGLGLIGQLTAQLLRAAGCRVLGFDPGAEKLRIAGAQGILTADPAQMDAVAFALDHTAGHGVDGAIITATATDSDIIAQAAQMCRKRGRIILSGVVGLNLNRADFYEKELSFQVSCSYGPGRYDPAYEQQGHDYPIGFVRWTEQRNFEAVLATMAEGSLNVVPLITQKVRLEDFGAVYGDMAGRQVIAALLQYDEARQHLPTIGWSDRQVDPAGGAIGLIGAGAFTSGVLLPGLVKAGAVIRSIASRGGLSAATLAKKYGVGQVTTDYQSILSDPAVRSVAITTRHRQHAPMVAQALRAGKHVFVEKPLAIDAAGLSQVTAAYESGDQLLTVGFNRRFAPLLVKLQQLLGPQPGPVHLVITVNAGPLPQKHWLSDAAESGGRIIGEGCHFIDLCTAISGAPVAAVCANSLPGQPDDVTLLLRLANGSNAVINYFTNGSKAYDKERIEVYSAGRTLILENWRRLRGYGFPGFSSVSGAQDKGHQALLHAWTAAVTKGGSAPIPYEQLINTTKASIAAVESLQRNAWVEVR